jgi:hypothetical protein
MLIIMAYSTRHETYVPVYYILLQSKKYLKYYFALQQVICNSAWSLLAASVTCDFEAGLIKAVVEQFPEAGDPNGCSFNFKKCNKDQLVKLGVHELLRDKLLRKGGLLDLLMVLPHSDIETHGKPNFYEPGVHPMSAARIVEVHARSCEAGCSTDWWRPPATLAALFSVSSAAGGRR